MWSCNQRGWPPFAKHFAQGHLSWTDQRSPPRYGTLIFVDGAVTNHYQWFCIIGGKFYILKLDWQIAAMVSALPSHMNRTQYWWIMASFPASGTRTAYFPCGAPGCHFHWGESVWRRHRIALMVQQYAVIKSSFWSTHISKNYFKWHPYYDWF